MAPLGKDMQVASSHDHVGVMVHIADGHGRSVSGGYGLDGFSWARFPLRRRRKQSDRASPVRRQALCNDLRVLLQEPLDGGGESTRPSALIIEMPASRGALIWWACAAR
jgi:hypothetical protein